MQSVGHAPRGDPTQMSDSQMATYTFDLSPKLIYFLFKKRERERVKLHVLMVEGKRFLQWSGKPQNFKLSIGQAVTYCNF